MQDQKLQYRGPHTILHSTPLLLCGLILGLQVAWPAAALLPPSAAVEIVRAVEAQAGSKDLLADLLWRQDPGVPLYLTARELDGTPISSTLVEPTNKTRGKAKPGSSGTVPAGTPITETLTAVIGDIATTGIHIRLTVETATGEVFSNRYSFVIEWVPTSQGCEGQVFGRAETTAVWMGYELDLLLDGATYSHLGTYLATLLLDDNLNPVIRCQTISLQTELARLDDDSETTSCEHFWQVVVLGQRAVNEFYNGPFPDGRPRYEEAPVGFVELLVTEKNADHCIDTLAVGDGAQGGVKFKVARVTDEALTTEFSVRRWFGPAASCSCAGDIAQSAQLTGLISAQATNIGLGSAGAWAGEDLYFTLDDQLMLFARRTALVQPGPLAEAADFVDFTREVVTENAAAPQTGSLRAVGGVVTEATGDSFARADYRSTYVWQQDATSNCTVLDNVSLILSPGVDIATRIKLEPYP